MDKYYMSADKNVGVTFNEIIRRLEKSSSQKSTDNKLEDFHEDDFPGK